LRGAVAFSSNRPITLGRYHATRWGPAITTGREYAKHWRDHPARSWQSPFVRLQQADLRASYDKAVKSNPRDLSFQSGGVNFSNDHSMAWDYGTFSQTMDGPKGKPVKGSGSFVNVWKNVGGRWLIVGEIGN